jgi:hypothetical protein
LDCVLRRVTLRPCNTGFDEKMKAKILGKVIMRSEGLARFISKRFEVLAWIFFFIFLAASVFSVRGLVLFYTTGSCNGLNEQAFCVFDPSGANNEISSPNETCSVEPKSIDDLTLAGVNPDLYPSLDPEADKRIFFIGCYACEYSRKAYPEIRKLADRYDANLVYLEYPVKLDSDLLNKVGICVYRQDPQIYWEMNDVFFSAQTQQLEDPAYVDATLAGLGIDKASLDACVADPQTEALASAQLQEIQGTNFYGTPTIFIGDEVFVGPKPYRVYAIGLEGFFYWLK